MLAALSKHVSSPKVPSYIPRRPPTPSLPPGAAARLPPLPPLHTSTKGRAGHAGPLPDLLRSHASANPLVRSLEATSTLTQTQRQVCCLSAASAANGERHHMRHILLAGLLLCTNGVAQAVVVNMTNVTLINAGPAYAVSGDGTYVAGTGTTAYRWTSGATQFLPAIPGGTSQDGSGWAVSDNGIVYGNATAPDGLHAPVRWENGQIQVLPRPFIGHASMVGATTTDGQAALISAYNGGSIMWTPTSTFHIRAMPGMPSNSVYAWSMTRDGQRIVGEAGNQAAIWHHPSITPLQLGTLPGSTRSFATATSSDATILAGNAYFENPFGSYRAFRWTISDGMQPIGDLPGGNVDSTARGISGDGQIIVGYSSTFGGTSAFLWTDSLGMVNLNELEGNPLAGTGWRYIVAWAISENGSTVVGTAAHPTLGVRGFVATIHPVPAAPSLTLLIVATGFACRRRRCLP